MSFSLESLGIKIHCPEKENFDEQVIKYCLDKINNQKIEISTQLLLANKDKITEKLLNTIHNNFSRNLVNKQKYLLKKLSSNNLEVLNDFLIHYNNSLKSIDTTFKLSDNIQYPLLYGNSTFIQQNLEILVDLIIINPKIRLYIKNYIFQNINNNSNNDYPIFKTLKKIDNYNLVIFDDLSQDLLEWYNQEIIIPEDYPNYMKNIFEINNLISKCYKIKNFINKNFPKKDYSNIYISILNNIFEDKFNNLIKKNINIGFLLICKFLDKLTKILDLLSDDRKDYYQNIINKQIEHIFKNIKSIENLDEMLRLYRNFIFIQHEIGSIFNKYKDSEIFNNILNTILNLSDINIKTFSIIINTFCPIDSLLIRLKFELSELIWLLDNTQINKIVIFINNLHYKPDNSNLKIINNILEDKKISENINNLITPHKIYHFSKGVWDFPMDNNNFTNKIFNMIPFKDELNLLYSNFTEIEKDDKKEFIVFSTKGKVLFELSDNINTLLCTFLPIQAMIIKYLIDYNTMSIEAAIKLCKNTGINIYKKVFDTILDIINIDDNNITLKEKLPYYGEKNFADLYFIETKQIMTEKINKEIKLSFHECAESNICSLLKEEKENTLTIDLLKSKLYDKIKNYHTFNLTDFEQVLKNMIKKDYISINNNYITYNIY